MKGHSDKNLMLVRKESSSQSRGKKIMSTPMHSENLYTVRSDPNLLGAEISRKKLNRDRINSQIFSKNEINEKDFIEPEAQESVSEIDDITLKKP